MGPGLVLVGRAASGLGSHWTQEGVTTSWPFFPPGMGSSRVEMGSVKWGGSSEPSLVPTALPGEAGHTTSSKTLEAAWQIHQRGLFWAWPRDPAQQPKARVPPLSDPGPCCGADR